MGRKAASLENPAGTIPLSIRLDWDIGNKLDTLAKATGRSKSYYINKILKDHEGELIGYYTKAVVEAIDEGQEEFVPKEFRDRIKVKIKAG